VSSASRRTLWWTGVDDLPSFDAETKSIFEAIAVRHEKWFVADPAHGDDVRAAEWSRRASEVSALGAR